MNRKQINIAAIKIVGDVAAKLLFYIVEGGENIAVKIEGKKIGQMRFLCVMY